MSFETRLMLTLLECSEPAGPQLMVLLVDGVPTRSRPVGLDLVLPACGDEGLV